MQTASGIRETLGTYSYDPTSGEYLAHSFGASGGVLTERGQRIPKGFVFRSERGTGADKVQVRFTIEEAAQAASTVTKGHGRGPVSSREAWKLAHRP